MMTIPDQRSVLMRNHYHPHFHWEVWLGLVLEVQSIGLVLLPLILKQKKRVISTPKSWNAVEMVVISSDVNTIYNSLASKYKEPGSCLLICSNLKVSLIENPTVALTVNSVIGNMLIQIFSNITILWFWRLWNVDFFRQQSDKFRMSTLPITESTCLDSTF